MAKKKCPCEDKLKELLPNRYKPRCMNKKEVQTWSDYNEVRTIQNIREYRIMISKMFSDIFNKAYFEPPVNGSKNPIIFMAQKIDIVYDNHTKTNKK